MRIEQKSHETLPITHASTDDGRGAPLLRPMLVASHAGGAEWVPIEVGRSLVVGRSRPSDLVVDSPHLSRCHARFTLGDAGLEVVDLESHNGTRVRGARVTRATMGPGEVAVLGRVRVSLQRLERGGEPTLPGHEAWFTWLQDELRRAAYFHRSFAILHVTAERAEQLAEGWLPAVRRLLRPVDRVAIYGPNAAWVLLPEATLDEAQRAARAITDARLELGPLFVGVSMYPGVRSIERLTDAARSAARRARPEQPVVDAVEVVPAPAAELGAAGALVAESPAMRAFVATLDRVASSELPVLLLGETGSGKEIAARRVHECSARRGKPLVPVSCGALPAHLVESTLFGHEKGSFTGAVGLHRGVFEAAHGGTVFLDEVGELPAPVQVALLRVLEAKRVARVGATQEIDVDVRIVAATHRDLEQMVREGRFRQDLLFRLETVTLRLPPLRDRREDILPLAERMLQSAVGPNAAPKRLSSEARAAVLGHAWPGNVRELKNAMDRAAVVSFGERVGLEDLPERLLRAQRAPRDGGAPLEAEGAMSRHAVAPLPVAPLPVAPPPVTPPPSVSSSEVGDLRERLASYEAAAVLEALRSTGGRQAAAAELLGLPLRTLKYKLAAISRRKR